jgi:hypothetical protein
MRLAGIPFLLLAATASAGDFHLDVGVHFGVPQREVIVVREQRLPDDELPVVFFISRHARVPPAAIVDLRLAGASWWDIAVRYRVPADVFYVPASPRYGRAHGHWKKRRLSDVEVIEVVNVRFLCDRYRIPPDEVYAMRSRGLGYTAVYARLSDRDHSWKHGKGKRHKKDDD